MALTVADVREHITSELIDPALQRLLDAAYEAVAQRAGATGAVTDMLRGASGRLLMLTRQASAITTVTEDAAGVPVTLNALDYLLRSSGSLLERLDSGPNPRTYWHGRVNVVYAPRAGSAERDRVAIDLIRNYLDFHPGATSERIGDWAQSFSASGSADEGYAATREQILETLALDPVGVY